MSKPLPSLNCGGIWCTRAGNRWLATLSLLIAVATLAYSQSAKSSVPHEHDSRNTSTEVSRGKYLVESVAMCGECHTPRDSNGRLDRSRWLQGAPVIWVSSQPDPNWPLKAPRIGGTPPASDADLVKLLTTGIWKTGQPLRPPMMPFRMSESDARAVVVYLRSLAPQP